MQLVSKISFFYSGDLRTPFARAADFPSRKKKYYFTHFPPIPTKVIYHEKVATKKYEKRAITKISHDASYKL
jgi:hypothetical protein